MELASRPDVILSLSDKKSPPKIKDEVTSKICAKGRAARSPNLTVVRRVS